METKKTEIKIAVDLDENHIPEKMKWSAPGWWRSEQRNEGYAFCLFWDAEAQETLKMDLWV